MKEINELSVPVWGKPGRFFNRMDEKATSQHWPEFLMQHGFYESKVTEPYYHTWEGEPMAEIFIYANMRNEKLGSILEIWDGNRSLGSFYCETPQDEFDCLSKFIEMKKNLLQIEKISKYLNKEEE